MKHRGPCEFISNIQNSLALGVRLGEETCLPDGHTDSRVVIKVLNSHKLLHSTRHKSICDPLRLQAILVPSKEITFIAGH